MMVIVIVIEMDMEMVMVMVMVVAMVMVMFGDRVGDGDGDGAMAAMDTALVDASPGSHRFPLVIQLRDAIAVVVIGRHRERHADGLGTRARERSRSLGGAWNVESVRAGLQLTTGAQPGPKRGWANLETITQADVALSALGSAELRKLGWLTYHFSDFELKADIFI